MRQVVFFGVAAHEREALARASFPDAACRIYAEPLDARLAAEAEVVSIGVQGLVTEELLAGLPRLRFLTTRSTGYDHVDLAACARRGIQVANVPDYSAVTVAEHAIGLAFALAHRLREALDRTRAHDFSLDGLVGQDLGGKTLGVVGAGTIGRHVLRNILIPVVTVVGIEFGSLVAFSTITETVFAWPGMGKLLIDSVYQLDRPVVVAYVLLATLLFVTVNFLVDILYAALDPRVKLTGEMA